MNKNNLIKIIGRELSILTDFVNGFAESENIHPMEVDLALSKAKDIYNELMLLKEGKQVSDSAISNIEEAPNTMMESQNTKKKPVAEPVDILKDESVYEKPIQTEILDVKEIVLDIVNEKPTITEANDEVILEKPIELIENEIVLVEQEKFEHKAAVQPIIEDEKILETNAEPVTEPKLPQGIVEMKPKKFTQKVNDKEDMGKGETIAEKFSKDSFSINDKLASIKNINDLGSKLKGIPITDLKKAIKLNDRVWFTKELFNKNSATFEKAVEMVNSSVDLDAALKYLLENYNWNQESQCTISFLELVFRRFASK